MLSSFLIDSAQQKAKTNDNSVHCLMNNQLETTDEDETKACWALMQIDMAVLLDLIHETEICTSKFYAIRIMQKL